MVGRDLLGFLAGMWGISSIMLILNSYCFETVFGTDYVHWLTVYFFVESWFLVQTLATWNGNSNFYISWTIFLIDLGLQSMLECYCKFIQIWEHIVDDSPLIHTLSTVSWTANVVYC